MDSIAHTKKGNIINNYFPFFYEFVTSCMFLIQVSIYTYLFTTKKKHLFNTFCTSLYVLFNNEDFTWVKY